MMINIRERWKIILQFLLGILVSTVLLAWLARAVLFSGGDYEMGDIVAVMRSIPVWVLVVALASQLLQTLLRAIRYRLFLETSGRKLSLKRLLALTFARNMFVDLLPSRAGEISYLFLLKRMLGERLAKGIASLGASFAFDLLALLVLISVMLMANAVLALGGMPVMLLVPLLVIVLIGYFAFFYGFSILMDWTKGIRTRMLQRGIFHKLNVIAQETDDSIRMIRAQGKLSTIFFLSLGVRFFKYSGMLLLLYVVLDTSFVSLGLGHFGSLLMGVVAGEATASLPIPGFMSFGTYEVGASLTLQKLGYGLQASFISVFIVHIISQCMDYTLGISALYLSWITGWLSALDSEGERKEQHLLKRIVSGALFLIVVGLLFLGYMFYHFQHPVDVSESVVVAEHMEIVEKTNVSPELAKPAMNVAPKLKGFAVWTSNRFGNHEIVRYDLNSEELLRLTHTEEKEWYPSLSHDGTKMVFARAKTSSLGPMDTTGWSIILMDLHTLEERMLSEEGFQPSWSADDRFIVFGRRGKQVVLLDIENGEEEILIESGKGGIPSGYVLYTPSYNQTEKSVAVTVRGSRRTKFVYKKNGTSPVEYPEGCQLAWIPGDQKLVFTNVGGIGGNAFYIADPLTDEITPLLDVPAAYSHEYFPRFSADARWLVFGASTGGHSHDSADYEIFLWEVGSSMDKIKRLSHDVNNDSWPDVFISP